MLPVCDDYAVFRQDIPARLKTVERPVTMMEMLARFYLQATTAFCSSVFMSFRVATRMVIQYILAVECLVLNKSLRLNLELFYPRLLHRQTNGQQSPRCHNGRSLVYVDMHTRLSDCMEADTVDYIYTIICHKSVWGRSQTAGRNSCSIASRDVSN